MRPAGVVPPVVHDADRFRVGAAYHRMHFPAESLYRVASVEQVGQYELPLLIRLQRVTVSRLPETVKRLT